VQLYVALRALDTWFRVGYGSGDLQLHVAHTLSVSFVLGCKGRRKIGNVSRFGDLLCEDVRFEKVKRNKAEKRMCQQR